MILLDRLVDDARLLGPGPDTGSNAPDPISAITGLVGRLVVRDADLAATDGHTTPGATREVSVLNTSGAGGLLALTRRRWTRLVVGATESTLRDLDDLAGNAARVVTAAQELDPSVEVFVGLPVAPGWVRAVEVVEAAGCCAKVDLADADLLVATEQLSVLVEADLAFKVSGLAADRLLPLLATVGALVDGAEVSEAARLLAGEHQPAAAQVVGWDEPTQARVRRRLRVCDSGDLVTTAAVLTRAGLIT